MQNEKRTEVDLGPNMWRHSQATAPLSMQTRGEQDWHTQALPAHTRLAMPCKPRLPFM